EDGPIILQPRELTPDAPDTDPLIPPNHGGPVVQVNRDGMVYVNDRSMGALRVEQPLPGGQLLREGAGLFAAPDGMETVALDARPVRQGFLEDSNVSAV